jgi:hypothetical protein
MKLIATNLLIVSILLISACESKKELSDHNHDSTSSAPVIQADTIKKSIPKEEHAQIGTAHVTIKYHAPAVRGRMIWGGLVPMGEVWVTGAHRATSFEINRNFTVGEKEMTAGKYAFFTIPGQEKWTIILNRNWDQHLTDEYDQKEDAIRLDVTPEQLQNIQERLKYSIVREDETKGAVVIRWEKLKISMPFQIK